MTNIRSRAKACGAIVGEFWQGTDEKCEGVYVFGDDLGDALRSDDGIVKKSLTGTQLIRTRHIKWELSIASTPTPPPRFSGHCH